MAVSLTVGGWFAQAFIKNLVDKVCDKAIQLFAERWGFTEDMDKLRTSLLETQIILDVVQTSRSNNTEWKTLMQELKDVAYDAEDLIDEFQYHVLRQKIKGEEENKASGSSGLPNVLSSAKKRLFGSSNDMRTRLKEIQGRLERIANSVKDIMKVLPPNDRGKQPVVKFQARESCSSPATDILFGRAKELNQVINWLLGSANQVEPASRFVNDTFSVLPIVGIGGVGKTTLAQYLHKDNRVQDHFQLKIWVCVSDNFTVQGLTKSIIQSVAPQGQYENMGLEPLRIILHEHIAEKKFLLFLDDVWSDDKSIWEKFCALLKVGAHGSKIIVTTRDMKVSKMVSHVEPILVLGLNKHAFWKLFKKCSFGTLNPRDYPVLEDIGRKIARKLKGSPLAAKTLGSVLQSDLSQQHWTTIMKSDIWKVKQDEDGIMPALHLSYQYLNENLKQCFAYCSLFPKDYEFDKAELIQKWMASGFIEDTNTKRMEDIGNDYFLEFINRSFFQEFINGRFVMHDLIHALAEMIAAEETKIFSSTLHLAVEEGKFPLEFSGYDKLRTLVLRNSPPDRLFKKLRSIRVLNVSGCGLQELSEHIGKLIHLRYLDISWNSEIKNLPDSLCDLYNLQTLKAIGCLALESIPQELGKLVDLRHIYADDKFWMMIKDVRRLTNLQELPTFSVLGDDGQKLGQLKDLTQLHSTLSIKNLQNVVDSKEAQMAELKNKIHLEELVLEWNHEKDAKLEEEVIEGLQPHKSLKILTIKGYNGGKSPSWLMPKVLSNLEKLELDNCKGWDDVLPFIGQRLLLIELRMHNIAALKQLSHEFEGKCFPKLEVLHLRCMLALEEWSWTEGKDLFPCLRELRVRYCPILKRLPPFPRSLERLTIEHCHRLILNSRTEDDEEGTCFPKLEVLELNNLQALEEWSWTEGKDLFPCLRELRVRYCSMLKRLAPFPPSLERLTMQYCPNRILNSKTEGRCFPKLEVLELNDLQALEKWSWTEGKDLFSCLRELWVCKCPILKRLPPFPPSLERLTIEHCPNLILNSKTEGGYLLPPSLQELKLTHSGEYAKLLPDCLHGLRLVTRLEISHCPDLIAVPLVQLVELQCLYISNCDELRRMECLGLLKSLKELKIVGCPNLVQLDVEDEQAGCLSSLRKLCTDNTALLKMFPLRNSLPFISELEIQSSSEVVMFEEEILVQSLTAVTSLTLRDCQKLPSLHSLLFLEELSICDCRQIQSLPVKGLPPLLKKLSVYGCPQLQAPENGLPTSLQYFLCLDVHPTLAEQCKKFHANLQARMKQEYDY